MNDIKMRIKTFNHDFYLYDLPYDLHDTFYKLFPFYYQNYDFQKRQITFAPVVRLYGTNQFAQKCCCHIHGFFPSFYVKCQQFTQLLINENQRIQFLKLVQSLYQKAYNVMKPVIYQGQIQEKYDFYGYHQQKQPFLKITIYDPSCVRPLMELLSSKIVSNKSFQCYEAHISYFSQMCTDLNLTNINEMKICGLTFRKNFEFMDLFQKMNPNLQQGIMKEGWNLIRLFENKPQLFNGLCKMSPCYLQFDLPLDSIINAYYEKQEIQKSQIDSSDEQMIEQKQHKKINVKLTKALGEIWKDEKSRRNHFKIEQPLQGILDFSKNVQGSEEVRKGQKDPLWIDFYQRQSIKVQFEKMMKTYNSSEPIPFAKNFLPNRNIIQNYGETMRTRNEKLAQNVEQKWKFYGKRKLKIIKEIMIGERGQFPQWNSQNSQNNESQHEDLEEMSVKSDYPKLKSAFDIITSNRSGNTTKYRGNFKVHKPIVKKNCYFTICQFCQKKYIECKCTFNKKQNSQQQKPKKLSKKIATLQYNILPPTIQQSLKDVREDHQQQIYYYIRLYFSKYSDLFSFYKISNLFNKQLKNAQYLDKCLKPNPQYPQLPIISIKNSDKLPYFWVINEMPSTDGYIVNQQTITLQYIGASRPSLNQCLLEVEESMVIEQQKGRNQFSFAHKQQTFVSNLVFITYELLVGSSKFYGNPETDQIHLICFKITNNKNINFHINGIIIQEQWIRQKININDFDQVFVVKDQRSLLLMFANIVFRTDPDLLISYDQQRRGIYYLTERGFNYCINIPMLLSRSVFQMEELLELANFCEFQMIKQTYLTKQTLLYGNILKNSIPNSTSNQYFINILRKKIKQNIKRKPMLRNRYRHQSVMTKGRVNLNIYRICQFQLKLKCYSLENVVKYLFGVQLPQYTDNYLIERFKQSRDFTIQYITTRLQYIMQIIDKINIINGIIEKSKVFGADFVSMMERGSQFKIQSVMCRVTKDNHYLTLSASKYQVANQQILQCRPFVAEPPKRFFSQPVLLFDFQSLYPSVMIAYNICYSTCLGSIKQLFKNRVKKMGVSSNMSMDLEWIKQIYENNPEKEAKKILQKYIFVSPNQVAFVRKNVREGLIPRILIEFLISRIMIKRSIKLYSKQAIKRLLKERQMALKLFMNVMYGYTGASFSGRMPCSQIADSVVEISKYCLKKSIDHLTNHPKYKGTVIYGDTDSIFFHIPNITVADSFQAGKILAAQITSLFPYPMQMKFQKVYQSLVLVSKKRYYGKSYQNVESHPKYEGKGLQCVRRDGIQLTCNLMKQMLNQLMDTKDLSLIKNIFQQNYSQLINGLKLQHELTLGKEVKLIKYSEQSTPAHGQAAKRLANIDPMLNPRYGERVKYIIMSDGSKALKHRSMTIMQYLMQKSQSKFQLDYQYYAERLLIPALSRTLTMVDLRQWIYPVRTTNNILNTNIFIKKPCLICEKSLTLNFICIKCLSHSSISQEIKNKQKAFQECKDKCKNCIGSLCIEKDIQNCTQLNCSNLYEKNRAEKVLKKTVVEMKRLSQAVSFYESKARQFL